MKKISKNLLKEILYTYGPSKIGKKSIGQVDIHEILKIEPKGEQIYIIAICNLHIFQESPTITFFLDRDIPNDLDSAGILNIEF